MSSTTSGHFFMRVLRSPATVAAVLLSFPLLTDVALAATPATGTVSPAGPEADYTSGPFLVSSPSDACVTVPTGGGCDEYALTVSLPAGYGAGHPLAKLYVKTTWTDGQSDMDLALVDSANKEVGSSNATDSAQETMIVPIQGKIADGDTVLTVQIIPFIAFGASTSTQVYISDDGTPPPPPSGGGGGSTKPPRGGTLTDTSNPIEYSAGPFAQANATPAPQVDTGPECNNPVQPCDDYELTVQLPADYATQHPNDTVKISMTWTDSGSGQSDYDLYIYKGDVTTTDGSQTADYSSTNSGYTPELAAIPVKNGTNIYTVKVVPYTPTGETVNLKIELVHAGGGALDPNFGKADPLTPNVPRFQTFAPPSTYGSGDSGQGEFNIGYNPKTGRILVMNIGPISRITPAERLPQPMPECCQELWEDVTGTSSSFTGLDPILWTEQTVGRTFATNATAGGPGYSYTDNDGGLWVPLGASPPSGGADHETFGSGPYPAGSPFHAPGFDYALYYCSQDIVGPATCQRSDDGGTSFGTGVLAYDGTTTACGGLHGHIRVAPDGTAWLPVGSCATHQGGAISTDAGVTWHEIIVPTSTSASNDPSIALDADSTAYFCYVNGTGDAANGRDGHVHVQVSHDHGLTWTNDFDLGASHGIENAAFTEAWGGSSGRAACGFLGTNKPGNYESLDFTGVWYGFVAYTYDGGNTWTTVNATPDDPVQGYGGIWRHGGGNQNRNLLDFNEITVDDKGYVLYGFDKGCVGDCVTDPANNSFTANSRVARQIGGKPLYAAFDTTEPAASKRPCLSGTRDVEAAHLTWKTPDSNGSAITGYKIYRGTSPGNETLLKTLTLPKNSFGDYTTDPNVPTYYYTVTAVNAQGESLFSNELQLDITIPPVPGDPCILPGVTLLVDSAGAKGDFNTSSAGPGKDLQSLQVSQANTTDGIKLSFRINTDPGINPQPNSSAWHAIFKLPNGSWKGVRMQWDSPAGPTFLVYVPGASNGGGVDGRFVDSSIPADPSSSYDAPNGHITIVAKLSDLGLAVGDVINGVLVATSESGVAAATITDYMPDGASPGGATFTIHDVEYCAPNAAPIPVLNADPLVGAAPLTVHFDASDSHDPDPNDTIKTYTFYFGDGEQPVTQSSPTISHEYPTTGIYRPTLKVIDSRDKAGTIVATRTITVNVPAKVVPPVSPTNNRLGGALPAASLALLGLAALLRRRRR